MHKIQIVLLIVLLGISLGQYIPRRKFIYGEHKVDKSDVNLKTPVLLRKYGYKVEEHEFESNGYYLTLQRIPAQGRPAVVLVHGIMCTSKIWLLPVTGTPKDSLGMLLADAGFDVWFFNSRGTEYSEKHKTFNHNSKEYWDFGIDEQSKEDTPALINYILEETGEKKLIYIGHSLGTLMFLRAAATFPSLNDKVSLFIGLAPGDPMGNATSPLMTTFRTLANPEQPLLGLLSMVARGKFVPSFITRMIHPIYGIICSNERFICDFLIKNIAGNSPNTVVDDAIDVVVGEFPGSTSVRTAIHFLQLARLKNQKSVHYDFGQIKNLEVYGSIEPPEYDYSKISVPTALYSGMTDALMTPNDAVWVASKLKNLVKFEIVDFPNNFAHHNFVIGKNVSSTLYKPLIFFINEYLNLTKNDFNAI